MSSSLINKKGKTMKSLILILALISTNVMAFEPVSMEELDMQTTGVPVVKENSIDMEQFRNIQAQQPQMQKQLNSAVSYEQIGTNQYLIRFNNMEYNLKID